MFPFFYITETLFKESLFLLSSHKWIDTGCFTLPVPSTHTTGGTQIRKKRELLEEPLKYTPRHWSQKNNELIVWLGVQ